MVEVLISIVIVGGVGVVVGVMVVVVVVVVVVGGIVVVIFMVVVVVVVVGLVGMGPATITIHTTTSLPLQLPFSPLASLPLSATTFPPSSLSGFSCVVSLS